MWATLWGLLTGWLSKQSKVNEATADFIGRLETRLTATESRLDASEAQSDRFQTELADLKVQLAILKLEKESLQRQLAECNGKHEHDQARIKQLTDQIVELEARIRLYETRLSALESTGLGS